MKTVNPYFLHDLLSPITGLADDDSAVERYGSIDPNSEIVMKNVIRAELRPYFLSLPLKAKERARLALSYYLSKPEANFGRVFDSCLPPFNPPDDPRQFFVWLWEELFPGEDFAISLEEFREIPDIHEPNRYR